MASRLVRLADGQCGCTRRTFLGEMGLGFAGMAAGALLADDGLLRRPGDEPSGTQLHYPPRGKSVIWIFLSGGYSHLETFDPKPALNKYAGMTFDKTPFANPVNSPLHRMRFRSVPAEEVNVRDVYPIIFPVQVDWHKHGESGIEITDWWPCLAECVDELCFVRNMWTTDNDHFAENQMHTGRHRLDEQQPSIGSWAHYGLGSLNDNLPKFVVLGGPTNSTTRLSIDSYYLGPQHAGVPITVGGDEPLPFGNRPSGQTAEEQAAEFVLIHRLNRHAAEEFPEDADLQARLRAYELAFRMQLAVPEAVDLAQETEATHRLYGLDNPTTRTAGQRLLVARRLVERGVRFVQVYPSSYGAWDSHQKLKENHAKLCSQVDRPVAGLITDLKQRGLLNETIVVFCTEFGRTPGLEQRNGGKDGRDHHPHGFTVWLAGAGLKKGYVHGATDELGYHALGDGHYVTDLHATVLRLLGLDNRRLHYPGRRRLEMDYGRPIEDILA